MGGSKGLRLKLQFKPRRQSLVGAPPSGGTGEGHILVSGLRNPLKITELKNTRFEVNEPSDGLNSKMEMKEGNACEVIDSPVEIVQFKDGFLPLGKV